MAKVDMLYIDWLCPTFCISDTTLDLNELSDLWAEFRRWMRTAYQMDVVASFFRVDGENGLIDMYCQPNVGYADENPDIPGRTYYMRWCKLYFACVVKRFSSILDIMETDLAMGMNWEEALRDTFPERKKRKERAARNAAQKQHKAARRNAKAAKDSNQNNPRSS